MRLLVSMIVLCSFVMAGCTTTPDPAEVCTARWIAPRAERAMNAFERDTDKIFRIFRKTADGYRKNGQVSPLQMLALMNAVSRLGEKMKNGRAMRDLRTLATTCNDPELIKSEMNKFLKKKGISTDFINFLNGLEKYRKLLEVTPNPPIKS